MLLTVNNKEYQKAQKRGYPHSYAVWAEYCNRLNSEFLNKRELISSKDYFNDIGNRAGAKLISSGQPVNEDNLDDTTKKQLAAIEAVQSKIGSQAATDVNSQEASTGVMNPSLWVIIFILAILGATYAYGLYESRKTPQIAN